MPLSPVYGHSPLSLIPPLQGTFSPWGEGFRLLLLILAFAKLVILIQRLGVAAIQRIARQGRQQLPAEVKRLLHRCGRCCPDR